MGLVVRTISLLFGGFVVRRSDLLVDIWVVVRAAGCPFSCSGHGVCVAGKCRCYEGYVGENCLAVTEGNLKINACCD